jgi:hypothetical protein
LTEPPLELFNYFFNTLQINPILIVKVIWKPLVPFYN